MNTLNTVGQSLLTGGRRTGITRQSASIKEYFILTPSDQCQIERIYAQTH